MTEHTAHQWDEQYEVRLEKLIERIVRKATRFAEVAVHDTERLERRIQRAAEKAHQQAERAEERASRVSAKMRRKVEKGQSPRMKDELRNLSLAIEHQALMSVEAALREFERHVAEIDVEAIMKRVEEELSDVDVEAISQQADQALREASAQIQLALERRGFVTEDGDAHPTPEPVSDEERLAVLRMVQNGTISAEEAEMLLDSLEGSVG